MKINKDTQVCISISESPGNTGTLIHNSLYEKYNLNFIYKSFKVSDVEKTVLGIKALSIRGCSVSMPFKNSIIKYLDIVDDKARLARSVNTVVNNNGILTGYNTDITGVYDTISSSYIKCSKAIVYGAGCTARSACEALILLGFKEIIIINRTKSKAKSLTEYLRSRGINANYKNTSSGLKGFMLINCTSVGMKESDKLPVSDKDISNMSSVFDVVCNETDLIQRARLLNVPVLLGKDMAVSQSLCQFKLYTNQDINVNLEKKFIKKIL